MLALKFKTWYNVHVVNKGVKIMLEEDLMLCAWCGDEYDKSDLVKTDLGYLCDNCVRAIESRGESIIVYFNE